MNAIINGVLNLLLFGGVVLIRRIVHKEGIESFWLQRNKKGWRLFFEGAAVGMIAFSIYPLLATVFQLGTINFAPQKIPDTALLILTQGFAFAGVALFEEALFRGYLLQKLLGKFSSKIAIGIVALTTGALHLFSYSSSSTFWIGLLNAIFLGILLSQIVISSHSLMWATGWHFAWNLTQSILLEGQNSGLGEIAIVNLKIQEGLWTGSSFVPESGIIVMLIAAISSLYVFRNYKATTLEHSQ
jgi:membrane protease YdiL (CAAX protease family)